MQRTSHRYLAKLPKAILALHEGMTLETLASAILQAMRILLDADVYTVDAISRRKPKCISVTWPEVVPDADVAQLNLHMAQHPSLYAMFDPEKWPVVTWSDRTTLRQFRQTGLYHDFFRRSGTNHQMAGSFSIDSESNFHAVCNRHRGDFATEERGALHLLLPHFRQAYRQAAARAELEYAVTLRELSQAGAACLLLAPDGSVLFATEAAQRLCRDYLGEECARLAPEALRRWLVSRPAGEERTRVNRGDHQLLVECGAQVSLPARAVLIQTPVPSSSRGYLLRLQERVTMSSTEPLRTLGLTKREAEVLFWMAQGKRDCEIATILGAQPRTIGKHVEHLFSKLQVETRTGAVAVAWQSLASSCTRIC